MTTIARSLGLAGLGVLLSLTACVSTHRTSPPIAAQSPAPPPTPAADLQPSRPDSQEQASQVSSAGAPVVSAVPACSCNDVKSKPKPKPKPKPKAIRKEAPPQVPTAPVVEQTPPGGLIDAQVRSMNVAVMSILGKRVRGAHGEDLGRVVDVLADASGRVRTAIIDFGGFLGVGNHRVAVDWPLLRFDPDGSDPSLLLSLSPEKLRTAPEYRENPRPQILMVPTASTTAPAD